jgi:hypothetical protein
MELKNIILSEFSQAQKTKNHMFPPHMRTLDLGQIQQYGWTWVTWLGESTYERYGDRLETQNMKVFDVPNAD